jgi:hypothetical protein
VFLALQTTNSNWFLGTIDHIHTGLIPANYVQPVRNHSMSSLTLQPQAPLSDIDQAVTQLSPHASLNFHWHRSSLSQQNQQSTIVLRQQRANDAHRCLLSLSIIVTI